MIRKIDRYQAYLFDLDGCIYNSNRLNPGSKELVNQLRKDNKEVLFVTNNSRQSASEIAVKLSNMGLGDIQAAQVFPATEYVGHYIKNKYGIVSVKVAGSASLEKCIEHYGHQVVPMNEQQASDLVVIGRDITFCYEKLQVIVQEIQKGAQVLATNPDYYHPGSSGERVPETGALAAAVEAMTGKKMESFGKPEPHLFHYSLACCGVEPAQAVMVGDNLTTDIAGSDQAGMDNIWINAEKVDVPDNAENITFIVDNIKQLYTYYTQQVR